MTTLADAIRDYQNLPPLIPSTQEESDRIAAMPDPEAQGEAVVALQRRKQAAAAAERIARDAHATQTDRAGKPYIGHIERVVANLLRRWPDATDDEIVAAWLHDVIEDTPWDADRLLKAGVSPAAVSIVQELSRPAGSTYPAWIERLAAHGSLSAVRVKLADNEDNSSPERVAAIPEGAAMLANRYQPARAMLETRLQTRDT